MRRCSTYLSEEMEIKEAERVVITKPVASKPTCSSFRSFSEFLASAINASPPTLSSEMTVPAIRPKTVRFKSAVNRSSEMVSLQANPSGTSTCNLPDKVLKTDSKQTVVYKPMAKLVSKTTVSLLANLGNFHTTHQQALQQVEASARHHNQDKHNLRSQNSSNLHQPSHVDRVQTIELSKTTSQNVEEDLKSLPPSASGDRASYDGYNWRKYGQKQVKGSEFPRSYYKCTHPNCPMKKKVERTLDGQIAEIVYKGEHNHSKPQPLKRNSSSAHVSDEATQDTNAKLRASQVNEKNGGYECRVRNRNEVGLSTPLRYHGRGPLAYNVPAIAAANTAAGTRDSSCGPSGEGEEGRRSKGMERDDEEPRSKRRRGENRSNEAGTSGDGIQEPRGLLQNSTDTEIMGDGFRWRKYGQKVVNGNSYPRSYYRCTNFKCNVRKHVERASDDPRAFITTYEGKHNHEMPIKIANSGASEPDSQVPSSKDIQ